MPESEYKYKQKVVTFGGGTGQSTLLRGVVTINNPEFNTAIIGGWDDGNVSGRLRDELGVLPPGDYMQCIRALLENDRQRQAFTNLLSNRAQGDPLSHTLASLAERTYHGVQGGIDAIRDLLMVRGKIIPVTLNDVRLNSTTRNGRIIGRESGIDHLKNDRNFSETDAISRIHFDTRAEANPLAIQAIREAQKIIFAPGSPYTSIFAHLLVEGISEAILEAEGRLILTLNLMTTTGEDHNLGVASRWLKVFQYYLGDLGYIQRKGRSRIDYLVVNDNHFDPEILEIYKAEGQTPVEIDDDQCELIAPGIQIIRAPLAHYDQKSHLLRHSPERLAEVVLGLD